MTIAVGFVVDDAIVVVENIYRHIEEGARPFRAALDGAREIGFTVVSISVSLVAVFIPAAADGRHCRAPVPRIRPHRDGRDRGLGAGFADADPDARLAFPRAREQEPRPIYLAIEWLFDALVRGYTRGLDLALRHRFITLMSFFATMAHHGRPVPDDPEGLLSDAGQWPVDGIMEAAQDVSPTEMKRLQRQVAELLSKDPDIAAFGSFFGSGSGNTLNTARFFIGLKPHEERKATGHADQSRGCARRSPGSKA